MPDVFGKLPGRGVWVSANREALTQSIKTGAFGRGFKSKVSPSAGLPDQVEDILCHQLLGQFSMAMKSGQATIGFDQVKSMAREEPIGLRIEASDGSEDGRGKIRVICKALSHEDGFSEPFIVGCFSAAELGKAFGRGSVVHAAIKPGKLARTIRETAQKLSGFRALVPQDWPDAKHETNTLFPACGNPESII